MEENASLNNISEVLLIDHERIRSILNESATDSSKNVLQVLSGITTYLREVVARYKYVGQTINSKQNLLKLREKYLRDDLNKLKNDQDNIEESSVRLQEKIDQLKNAQYALFSRALDSSEVVCNLEDENIANVYRNWCQTLNGMQKRVDALTKKLDVVKERQKMVQDIVNHNQTDTQNQQVVLNNEQLDLIKCSCEYVGESVQVLVDKVVCVKKELDEL